MVSPENMLMQVTAYELYCCIYIFMNTYTSPPPPPNNNNERKGKEATEKKKKRVRGCERFWKEEKEGVNIVLY